MTFIRYISSAGSGKTYALVKEYLKLVLKDRWKFTSVLAITFTNKAATEMKERIIAALKNLSLGREPKLEKEIAEETGLERIAEKSSAVMAKILHNYSDFAVMTIDSFFYKLLRSFSYEEEIPAGFEVELNLKSIDDSIIKKIYSSIGKDESLTEIIIEFVFSKIYAEKSFNIEKDIRTFEKDITNDRRDEEIKRLMKIDFTTLLPAVSELKKIFMTFVNELNDLLEKGVNLIEKSGLSINDFYYRSSGAASFMKKNIGIRPGNLKNFKMNSYFKRGEWYGRKTSPEIVGKIDSLLEEGLDNIREKVLDLFDREFSRSLTAYLIFENIYLLGLTGSIASFIEEYKRENNIIPITEFNRRIFSIISEDDIPFVYSILGNRFSNILIDEFQDTSRMQWESIYPLIENSLAEGNRCLAVGDPKQSIYRWRGGELEIIEKDIPQRVSPEQLKTISLKTNYRAFSNIVEFNNGLFTEILNISDDNPFLNSIYSDPLQNSAKGAGGFVSVDFVEGRSADVTDPIVFARIREIIGELTGKGFNYSDIVILTRKNSEAEKVSEYLLKDGFPVISPDSLKLSGSALTGFMVNLFKLIMTPDERLTIAEILFFMKDNFKNSLSAAEIEKYLLDGNAAILPPDLSSFLKQRDLFLRLPLYEITERIIRTFRLSESLQFTASGFLTAFLDMVLEYTRKEGADISNFFKWWEVNSDDFLIPGAGGSDGINLMTIHKAKGLQFNCVIIPYAHWRYRSDGNVWVMGDKDYRDLPVSPPCYIKSSKAVANSMFSDSYGEELRKSELDNVNMFYVACTRAVESLYIISGTPAQGNQLSNARILYDFVTSSDLITEVIPEKRYAIGSPGKSIVTEGEVRSSEIMKEFLSEPWSDRITLRRRSGEFSTLIPGETGRKIRIGNIIHKILSEVTDLKSADLMIERMISSEEIERDKREVVEKTVHRLFKDERTYSWFLGKGEILNEVTLIDGDDIFRPDKISIEENIVTVVDFKSGVRRSSDVEQVERYKKILSDMGYGNVEGFLYYLEDNEMERV